MKNLTTLRTTIVSTLLVCLYIGVFGSAVSAQKLVTNHFTESDQAFANPYKGMHPCPYSTLFRQIIPWNAIEREASDGVDVIRHYSDSAFNPRYLQGMKVIPRVYLCWPDNSTIKVEITPDGKAKGGKVFWPRDMTAGDYTSDHFKERVVRLIAKMGEAWDNDPRVSCIEMGIIGKWGEQHSPHPSLEMQQLLGNEFLKAFKNKKVMVRYFYSFKNFSFGYYWDSFGHIDEANQIEGMSSRGAYWKNNVNGGETAFDWGNYLIQPGKNPTEALGRKEHLDYLIDCARIVHTNHLGWIGLYDQNDAMAVAGAKEFQKVLGYRFVINKVSFTPQVTDHSLRVVMDITNVGSTPLYDKYPLEISLIDQDTKKKVWSVVCGDVDCRTWMPGDAWNKTSREYDLKPTVNIVDESLNIHAPNGEYLLAVTLLDPYTLKPAARFAVDNYLSGGYTLLGRVCVGSQGSDYSLKGIVFDNITAEKLIP